jgi:hypothetical protein
MPDGTWVCWMLAADGYVRTLGGARCGAPLLGRGVFCKRGVRLFIRSTRVGTCSDFEVGGAIAVGEMRLKTLKVAPCYVYRLVSLRIH